MSQVVTAPVFDIQRFSIHDGPGIRTLVFLKGCNLHCDWCQNPESQAILPVIAFHEGRCLGCFDCEQACGEQAISRDGFRVRQDKCTVCGACVEVCSYKALRVIGEHMTPDELLERVLRDKPYFTSGGGVTVSGGEPTLHTPFLRQFIRLCHDKGVHTCIETAGLFQLGRCLPLFEDIDLIYFDLKILDAHDHERAVGPGLETIMSNAAYLATHDFPVQFRMPVIPGYTSTQKNVDAVIAFLRRVGHSRLHLLPYHNMGESKIDIIAGNQPKLPGLRARAMESLAYVRGKLRAAGIEGVGGQ